MIHKEGFVNFVQPYPKGWKALHIKIPKPSSSRAWMRAVWGTDIWVGPVPLVKLSVALNLATAAAHWV